MRERLRQQQRPEGRTTDLPLACRACASATTDDLTDLSFPDARHGWAVGGIDGPTIEATSDGGHSWHAQHGRGTNGLNTASFPDDRHRWAVGIHNLVLTTSDGGAHWTDHVR